MVSIYSPLNINAQSSALSQNGNGESEKETGQRQTSKQNGQVVSGDRSILSGNNVLCQSTTNSNINSNVNSDCPANTLPPRVNPEACVECLVEFPSPLRNQIAAALGVPVPPNIHLLCQAIDALSTGEFIQKLAQSGMDPVTIDYVLRCMFLAMDSEGLDTIQ